MTSGIQSFEKRPQSWGEGGGANKRPIEIPRTSMPYGTEGFKDIPQLNPIIGPIIDGR